MKGFGLAITLTGFAMAATEAADCPKQTANLAYSGKPITLHTDAGQFRFPNIVIYKDPKKGITVSESPAPINVGDDYIEWELRIPGYVFAEINPIEPDNSLDPQPLLECKRTSAQLAQCRKVHHPKPNCQTYIINASGPKGLVMLKLDAGIDPFIHY